ncbi:MAG TPA: type IV pilus secretin PilQ [Pyrinomonadaceae bacterium]|nr:type IV pilus secretin PilQ [Pyrinomonadaceae bacterium]
MAHTKLIPAFVGRGALVLLLSCALGTLAPAAFAKGATRPQPPVARSVRAITSGEATLITIAGTAPMPYSVRRAGALALVVELPGVDASQLAPAYDISSPLVAGVSVARAVRNNEPQASLQIALRAPARERSHLAGNDLVFELTPAGPDAAQARPTPTPGPQSPDGQLSVAPPPTQGQQYGSPGFVGEPISLNVVNADIRDILNYITEQYGVNFVVDASVKQVPVTINVTDVPWNFALDSLLKANRLGIETNGNILRIATLEILKDEARIRAEEESARSALRAAQLENAPLVTEFIRLNYARALGTLAGAHGSAGGFSGGSTNTSYSGGAGGDASGTGADTGILPIISKRLSRRGSVEVDGRSNTLIVTDVRENVDAVRRLVQLLDQPEPQVEIETRIVIATRTFSRDLGVQLAAAAENLSRGGLGTFSTLPTSTTGTSGTSPFGVPGGLANTTQPTGALRAVAANTVIGLTTGIFGTAQISALISAAEAKGQAKIVATPRVSALNNRPAQIEAGSQIPVVTPQTGTGGASVFTTTFVAVPLRLSVTPQITDAGTVVLRVVMENNSVNLALTNSLGTPGIDTQRMQTEVLVPDGGTTVVGGVLNDRESETQNRTPGLGTIPVLGNLFKRRAVSRSTDEILFFITPRVYRPDFQGNRIENAPTSGTRSVQLPQPVPLGNPETNTPTPPAVTQPNTPGATVPVYAPQGLPVVTPQPTPNPAAPAPPSVGARP